MCKKRFSFLLVVTLVVTLLSSFSTISYAAPESNASTSQGLADAINNAATDGTKTVISITGDIELTETITLPIGANITLKGDGGKITIPEAVNPAFSVNENTNSNVLSFEDIKIEDAVKPENYSTANRMIYKGTAAAPLNIYGASIISSDAALMYTAYSTRPKMFTDKPVVNIYGGNLNCKLTSNSGHICNIYPTSNISITGLWTSNISCVPQDSFTIIKATINGESFISELNRATSDSPYSVTNNTETTKTILIEGSSSGGTNQSSLAVMGSLTSDNPEPYECGDTVKVTAKLTPDAAAKLSSGSLKFSYDTEKLTFTGAVVNEALKEGQATLYDTTPGTCVASFKGDPLDVTTEGLVLAEFSFEAVNDGTAEFRIIEAVAADEKASACTTNTGDSLSVTINALPKVTTDDFGSDYKMVKYVADALPEEGNAYFIGDTALTCVPAYATGDNAGKYIFVMLSKDKPTDTTVTTKAGTYGTIAEATGDANGDAKTNIIDAQVVYYMTTNKITSSDTGYDWLNSDVNGDCTLNALDAHAIQYFVHYGKFGQFSS